MSIEERIQAIQNAFQIGKLEGETRGLQAVFNFETDVEKELLSVAMEGCSMGIAINSFKNHHSLSNWQQFVREKGEKYLSQLHIGLGWALAELQLPVEQYISNLEAKWQLRVLDGFGYYSGLFKRRDTIRNMIIPEQIPSEMQAGFDQGIGRILFYLSNGNVERLERSIALFPDSRHPDFWRGIGIAVTFIGCDNLNRIQDIFKLSDIHSKQFSLGAAMAKVSLDKTSATSKTSLFAQIEILKSYPTLSQSVFELEQTNIISFSSYMNQLINI